MRGKLRKHGNRRFRAYSGHGNQKPETIKLIMSGKAIKIKRILLNGKMSEKADGRADGAYCFAVLSEVKHLKPTPPHSITTNCSET